MEVIETNNKSDFPTGKVVGYTILFGAVIGASYLLYVDVIKPVFGSLGNAFDAAKNIVTGAVTSVVTTVTGTNSTAGQFVQNLFGRTTGDNESIVAGIGGIASVTDINGTDYTPALTSGITVTSVTQEGSVNNNSANSIYIVTLSNGNTIYVDSVAQPTAYNWFLSNLNSNATAQSYLAPNSSSATQGNENNFFINGDDSTVGL